jgi:hypothetical protein
MCVTRLAQGFKVSRAICFAAVAFLFPIGVRTGSGEPAPQASSQRAGKSSGKLAITTKSLLNATLGVEYYAVIAATGGEQPYDFSGTGLPDGLAFHDMSDTIGGKANTPGTYSVVIRAKDSTTPEEQTATATLKLTVVAAKK